MGPISVKLTGDLFASVCQDEPMLRAHVATIRLADVGKHCCPPHSGDKRSAFSSGGVVGQQHVDDSSSLQQHHAHPLCLWQPAADVLHVTPAGPTSSVWV